MEYGSLEREQAYGEGRNKIVVIKVDHLMAIKERGERDVLRAQTFMAGVKT